MFTRNECGDSEGESNVIIPMVQSNCEEPQCYRVTHDGSQYTPSNYGNQNTWEQISPGGIITNPGVDVTYTYGQCSEFLSDCLTLSNASNVANDANACEEPQCWSLVSDAEGLFSVSNYGSINTWSNDICNLNDYGVACYSNQAQVSNLASLCNCESREPVTCYTSNDSITYRKNDSYYVLSGEVCALSNQSCESNETIMNQASNNCVQKECMVAQSGHIVGGASNVGYSWSNTSNDDGSFGSCSSNGECLTITNFDNYVLESADDLNMDDFELRRLSGELVETDADKAHYLKLERPMKVYYGDIIVTLINQPIDMTKSFTVIYWHKRGETTSFRTMITEHVHASYFHHGRICICS
jgi:hypothetical protein